MGKIEIQYDENTSLGKYGSDFRYGGKSIKFSEHIRGLKSVRHVSSYIDFISAWESDTNNKITNIDDFGLLSNYIQFFSDFCEFTIDFIKKYDVKPYHISLIRYMCFDYDVYYDDNNKRVILGYKRPYGNSDVYGDIADEYLKYSKYSNLNFDDIDDKYDWIDDNREFLLSIHMKTLEIFDKALDELNMPLHFESNKRNRFINKGWEVSKTWNRKRKIDKLINY